MLFFFPPLTTYVDQARASKVNEHKSAKIKTIRKEREYVCSSRSECSIAELIRRPCHGRRTCCVSSWPKESSKTRVDESLREREREHSWWRGARRRLTNIKTHCHAEGVDKDSRCSQLYSVTNKSASQDGSSVGGKGELERNKNKPFSLSLSLSLSPPLSPSCLTLKNQKI